MWKHLWITLAAAFPPEKVGIFCDGIAFSPNLLSALPLSTLGSGGSAITKQAENKDFLRSRLKRQPLANEPWTRTRHHIWRRPIWPKSRTKSLKIQGVLHWCQTMKNQTEYDQYSPLIPYGGWLFLHPPLVRQAPAPGVVKWEAGDFKCTDRRSPSLFCNPFNLFKVSLSVRPQWKCGHQSVIHFLLTEKRRDICFPVQGKGVYHFHLEPTKVGHALMGSAAIAAQ